MKDGYIKVAAITPDLRVADVNYNTERICEKIIECSQAGAKAMAFPELCITGYSCGDLFLQDILLNKAVKGLKKIAKCTEGIDAIVFVGLPLCVKGKLYNAAAALHNGEILGIVPKTFLPNYNEFYEARYFTKGMEETVFIELGDEEVPMGKHLLFACDTMKEFVIGVEICEDLWAPNPPSIWQALFGATLIVNLSASDEAVGKEDYRRALVCGQSARLLCGYVYAGAGIGESTQDVVYAGHSLIAENGVLLAESAKYENGVVYSEIDLQKLNAERRRNTTFEPIDAANEDEIVPFSLKREHTALTRKIDPSPFIPHGKEERDKRCEEILSIQAMGLRKRLLHTGCQCAAVGISGGLDSTLALLVTVRAFDSLLLPRSGIRAVTMPGFGTTDRTYTNAVKMIKSLGASFQEVSIKKAVEVHFGDIGQDVSKHDVTYENAQARERTQILMDIANKEGGMVIGTGDLSELALGWATYNGDHMSMYAVNASVPKTLVRHLVRYSADICKDIGLKEALLDVLDTPVSPELLPPEEGEISQKTEDLVGPYELHDFFLYYMLRFGFPPKKIYRLAKLAFYGIYEEDVILHWLRNFYRRFFSQQFKRSCLPDGPKVGTVAVSPRGDLRMPSDASAAVWLKELEKIK